MTDPDAALRPVLGIFVGGASRRMGGRPKGLLPSPVTSEPLVAALARLGRELGLETVLVGDATPYAALLPTLAALADRPAGIGPLGGLAALLDHAGDRPALAVACDMPFVSRALLARLAAPGWAAPVVAARGAAGDFFEPLLARYDAPRVRAHLARTLAAGERSFQHLLARVAVEEFILSADERPALTDWDCPADLPRG